MSEILLEYKGLVATVIINRPAQHNVLSTPMWQELTTIFNDLAINHSARVVILRGAGDKAFSTGFDIREYGRGTTNIEDKVDVYRTIAEQTNSAIAGCPKPVIAMIYGSALGAGLTLALACDMRFAADNVKFAMPHTWGITLGLKDTDRLKRVVGEARAREMLLTGKWYGAEEACRMNLVNWVISFNQLEDQTRIMAEGMANLAAPSALRQIKANFASLAQNPSHSGIERPELPIGSTKEDALNLIEGVTAYVQRRRPVFLY